MSEPVGDGPLRVACIGGSITFGFGLADRRQECYPAVLQQLLDQSEGKEVYWVRNFGFSGATVSQHGNEPYWRTSSFVSAERFKPNMALIMLGTNDAQQVNATARGSLGADLADLAKHFRSQGAEVLIGLPPPIFPFVAWFDKAALDNVVRPTIRRVAQEINAPLIDFQAPLEGKQEYFSDGLHPNPAGARQIAEIAWKALVGMR